MSESAVNFVKIFTTTLLPPGSGEAGSRRPSRDYSNHHHHLLQQQSPPAQHQDLSMQRVISLQTSRNADRGSSEFVTKRLCCSFLFSVAFLSLLGGFLLGRYATDRAILLKNAALQERQHTEEKFSHDIMNNLTSLMNDINRSISDAHITDFNLYLRKLNCTDASLTTHHNATHFDANMASNVINLKTTQFLNGHLRLLSACFTDIYTYLEELPHDPGNKDTVTSVKSD